MARKTEQRVAVIGLGFVGLTTALGFAHKGSRVFGFDVDRARTRRIRSGRLPFHEPHLDRALEELQGKKFHLASSLAEAVRDASVIFYCVGTPSRPSGAADVSFLAEAVKSTLAVIPRGDFKTLVIKSTIPPGTTQRQVRPLFERAGREVGEEIGLANNPEFLREGLAWEDFTQPDRIVIGAGDIASFTQVAALYSGFNSEIFHVSLSTAEFIKATSNALLATLISFSNEASMIADHVGDIDVKRAFEVLHQDRRWSGQPAKMSSYAFPGCGFGGYCLPKDVAALEQTARAAGVRPRVLSGVIAANRAIKEHFAAKIIAATRPDTRIGVLGLSFKPGSDDVRESPAADIIELLLKAERRRVIAYDPMAMKSFRKLYAHPIQYARDMGDLTRRTDVIAVLTAWPEFKLNGASLNSKPVFDGRHCLQRTQK
jgi:UDPglucose 6-dehydrogenase